VEAGCGWGGLALHMARASAQCGHSISPASNGVCAPPKTGRRPGGVRRDDTNISGQYGCLHRWDAGYVGIENYSELGRVVALAHGYGRGLIHSIGRNRRHRSSRSSGHLPGAYAPALSG
jgi:hypothetical protein